jgi:secretion/DNA translocation related TadE-like protein
MRIAGSRDRKSGQGRRGVHDDRVRWRDRGAASILVLAIGLVLVAAGIAGAAVGAARVGRHQARTAADLGALAGAARAVEGAEVACERAGRLAFANGGRMTACRVDGLEIVVEVEVVVRPLPGLTRDASAAARAGPVSMPSE